MTYRAIVSSHMNPYLSGVAKFNHILAERLGTRCVALDDDTDVTAGPLLVSVRLSEHDEAAHEVTERFLDRLVGAGTVFDLFFHTYDGLTTEHRLIESCRTAFVGNEEIAHSMRDFDADVRSMWCPALIDATASVGDERVVIFSFGMSHKIQLEYYEMLGRVLEESGIDYALRVSTAFHEKASFGDIDEVERRFREQFGERAHLLGFLSDAAINHFLESADVFCAFFRNGVRANNTSVYAAMAKGCALLTNLDEFSPRWMRHGENVLDIHQLDAGDLAPERLRVVGGAALAGVSANASWDLLVERLEVRNGRTDR